jgi:hypothetical protein
MNKFRKFIRNRNATKSRNKLKILENFQKYEKRVPFGSTFRKKMIEMVPQSRRGGYILQNIG